MYKICLLTVSGLPEKYIQIHGVIFAYFTGVLDILVLCTDHWTLKITNYQDVKFFTPWPFRWKGYCRCLCLSRLSVCLSVRKLYLVSTITHHRLELESPNLYQTCILGYLWLVLKMEVIDLWSSRSFWPFWLRIVGNSVCTHNNLSQIWARITKCAPNMHSGIL